MPDDHKLRPPSHAAIGEQEKVASAMTCASALASDISDDFPDIRFKDCRAVLHAASA